MYNGNKQVFYDDFYETFKFFWPFPSIQANLLIVLDDENEDDHEFEIELTQLFELELSNEIKNNYFNYYITFEEPNDEIYNHSGWNRQQWSMFWCDKFLNKLNISDQYKWVGFIDSDAIFTSIITPQTIFSNHKNITNPMPITIFNPGFHKDFFRKCAQNTPKWFGKAEYFKHMDQWPATFKVEHIQMFRETTVKYWFKNDFMNHNFDEIVYQILRQPPFFGGKNSKKSGTFFSQFNIFATWVWHYAQNEYEWYLEPPPKTQWMQRKKMQGIKGNFAQIFNLSEINIHNGENESMVRIAAHERHHETTAIQVISKGYCFSTNWASEYCRKLNDKFHLKNKLYKVLFQFASGVGIWATDKYENQSLQAQIAYYRNVQETLPVHSWRKHHVIENFAINL